jgi:hypothetical protein
MLGIPTRSDAAKDNQDYANAVLMDVLGHKLQRLRDVFSDIFAHNHVIEAYRDAGLTGLMPDKVTDLKPHKMRYWGRVIRGFGYGGLPVVSAMIPRAAERLLKPELVRDHFLEQIQAFRPGLEEARPLLDHESNSIIQGGDGKAYTNLLDIVEVEECAADYVPQGNAMVYKKGQGHGWKYTYNPYQLATRMLDEFQSAILSLYELEPTGIEKIVSMMVTAESMEESGSYRLVEGALWIDRGPWPSSIEWQEDHPVHELYKVNEEVSKRSDLSLRFDEWCFVMDTKSEYGGNAQLMIPFAGMLSGNSLFHCFTLSHRANIRFLMRQVLENKGEVIINGVCYRPMALPIDGESVAGFHTDGPSFQEFANLLGRPVLQPDGAVLQPEPWAATEVQLVDAYWLGDMDAADQLITTYDCDVSQGNPSREKALEQLAYSLRTDRF